MDPRQLKVQKAQPKRLQSTPSFKTLKKGKLPKPLAKLGGPRLSATDPIEVSPNHLVVFVWKDGEILTDRAFYGWLFKKVGTDNLYPLMTMHWHPCHKGLHIKVPCKTTLDYTNRDLPGAPELDIHTAMTYDPKSENDRLALMDAFCRAAGIKLGAEESLW